MARSKSAEKEEFWRLVLEEHDRSGMTVKDFCVQQGVSIPSFYAWRRKIQLADADEDSQQLVPVTIVDSSKSSGHGEFGTIEIVTPTGYTLRIDHRIESADISRLLQAIVSSGTIGC